MVELGNLGYLSVNTLDIWLFYGLIRRPISLAFGGHVIGLLIL